jgi:hypothetical protein
VGCEALGTGASWGLAPILEDVASKSVTPFWLMVGGGDEEEGEVVVRAVGAGRGLVSLPD